MDLSLLGLNDYESRSYLALLELGKSTASKISSYSGVPYGRIYDTLASLVHKEIVTIVPNKTKEYVASSPDKFEKILNKKRKELENINENVLKLKELFKEKEKQPVQVAFGKIGFHKLLREVSKNTKIDYSIKYYSDTKPEIIRSVRENIKKGATYKSLARYDDETKKSVDKWQKEFGCYKQIENDGVAIAINEKEVLLGLIKSNTTVLIKDKAFSKMIINLFEAKYDNTKKINIED